MRKFLIVSVAVAIFLGCSAPKYTYYFDLYSAKNIPDQLKEHIGTETEYIVSKKNPSLTPEVITPSSKIVTYDHALVANMSKEILFQQFKKIPIVRRDSKTRLTIITRADRKGMIRAVKEFKGIKRSGDATEEGDKSKNGAAVAGAAFSLAALIGILVSAPILMIFSIIGIVLSIIGLKSERKILSIIGLIMGVSFLVFALIALNNSLYSGSEIRFGM